MGDTKIESVEAQAVEYVITAKITPPGSAKAYKAWLKHDEKEDKVYFEPTIDECIVFESMAEAVRVKNYLYTELGITHEVFIEEEPPCAE